MLHPRYNVCYLIDNMEFMKDLPDNAYDLAIVDPPYGIGAHIEQGLNDKRTGSRKKSKWGGGKWDCKSPEIEYFINLMRVSKNYIVWGGNYFDIPHERCVLVWDKVQRIDQADCELAWTTFKTSSRIFTYSRSLLQGFQNPDRFHPTEKPVALYKWLLQNYAKPGQTIFDSHVGSGSIRIACHDMGYDFTGCEIDPDYHAAQQKRFQTHIAQAQLFDPVELTKETYRQEEL